MCRRSGGCGNAGQRREYRDDDENDATHGCGPVGLRLMSVQRVLAVGREPCCRDLDGFNLGRRLANCMSGTTHSFAVRPDCQATPLDYTDRGRPNYPTISGAGAERYFLWLAWVGQGWPVRGQGQEAVAAPSSRCCTASVSSSGVGLPSGRPLTTPPCRWVQAPIARIPAPLYPCSWGHDLALGKCPRG